MAAAGGAPTIRPSAPWDIRGPVLAFATVAAFLIVTLASGSAAEGTSLPRTLNPTGCLSLRSYLLLYILTVPAKHVMDAGLVFFATRVCHFRRMDAGETKVKRLETLEGIDLSYLVLNTMVEFIGMNHIVAFLISDNVLIPLSTVTILNGPLAFVVAMLLNDIIYYPFHVVAHVPRFYPYCHKQHHRQFLPFRGYADAANQHPIEQLYGFSIFIVSLYITSFTVGLHMATACCAVLAWALFNVANHLAFDSSIHLPLPYPAFPRDHQMHHRLNRCNYSTLSSVMDRAFGTFRPYQGLSDGAKGTETNTEGAAGAGAAASAAGAAAARPEAVPSPWSVVGLALGLVVAGLLAETARSGASPPPAEVVQALLPTVAVLVTAATGCAASGLVASLF